MDNDPLYRSAKFKPNDLIRISGPLHDERESPLHIGDVVRLNSGGPPSLVVDLLDGDEIVIAWRSPDGSRCETVLPRACLHRGERFVLGGCGPDGWPRSRDNE